MRRSYASWKHGRGLDDDTSVDSRSAQGAHFGALALPYVSSSCKDAIETGNHYQSVSLGHARTQGFRSDRNEFLDLISFEGKRVLDLGSNLAKSAAQPVTEEHTWSMDFEYDPLFVEIACALNALIGRHGSRSTSAI